MHASIVDRIEFHTVIIGEGIWYHLFCGLPVYQDLKKIVS